MSGDKSSAKWPRALRARPLFLNVRQRSVFAVGVFEFGDAVAQVFEAQTDGANGLLAGVEFPRRPQHPRPLEARLPLVPPVKLYLVLMRGDVAFVIEVPDEIPHCEAEAEAVSEVAAVAPALL